LKSALANFLDVAKYWDSDKFQKYIYIEKSKACARSGLAKKLAMKKCLITSEGEPLGIALSNYVLTLVLKKKACPSLLDRPFKSIKYFACPSLRAHY